MTCRLAPRTAPILHPTVRGWESEDGYLLVLTRGAYSRRPLGRITDPDGHQHLIAGRKHEPLSAILGDAEDMVRCLRRGGQG